jgi:hypothetical protein
MLLLVQQLHLSQALVMNKHISYYCKTIALQVLHMCVLQLLPDKHATAATTK